MGDDAKRRPDRPRVATIKDVATTAGVSIATVSAVLNGTARVSPKRSKLVRDAVAALGYSPHGPARSLRLGTTKAIGIIVGDIANPFFTSLIRTVEQKASEAGYFVIVANSDDDMERELSLLKLFREQRVAGVLLAPTGDSEAYGQTIAQAIGVPVVLVDRALPNAAFDTALVDNVKAAQTVTDYLLKLGHRRIGIVMGKQHLWTTDQRLKGYRAALRAANVPSDGALECIADSRAEVAYRMVQKLLVLPDPPTAIFAANNLMMMGAFEAIIDMGFRCPDDISIAGIDDLPWSSGIRPRLTTVAQPIEQLGSAALEMLLNRLEHEKAGLQVEPERVLLQAKFLIRESCAPPLSHA